MRIPIVYIFNDETRKTVSKFFEQGDVLADRSLCDRFVRNAVCAALESVEEGEDIPSHENCPRCDGPSQTLAEEGE